MVEDTGGRRTRSAGRPRSSEEAQAAFSAKIVDIARALFFENGFASVSMRKIAERAGCSPMSIYYYFPNKHAILRYIWISIFDEINSGVEEAARGIDDPLGALRAMALAYTHYWSRHPEHFHIVYLTTDPNSIALGSSVLNTEDSSVRRLYDRFDRVLVRCAAESRLAGPSPAVMAQTLFSGIYGMLLCTLTIPEYQWLPADQLAEEVIDHFIRGYRPPLS